jgi:hypothetical protein
MLSSTSPPGEIIRQFSIYRNVANSAQLGRDCLANNNIPRAIAYFRYAISTFINNPCEFSDEQQVNFKAMQSVLLEHTSSEENDVIYNLYSSWLEDLEIVTPATMHKKIKVESFELINKNIYPLALVDALNFKLKKYDHYLHDNRNKSYQALDFSFQVVHCLVESISNYPLNNISSIVASITDFLRKYIPPALEDQYELFNPTLIALSLIDPSGFNAQDKENWHFLTSHIIQISTKGFYNNVNLSGKFGFAKMLNFCKRIIEQITQFDKNWNGYAELRESFFLTVVKEYIKRTWKIKFVELSYFYILVSCYYNDYLPSDPPSQDMLQSYKDFHEHFMLNFKCENVLLKRKLVEKKYLTKLISIQNVMDSNNNVIDPANRRKIIAEISNFRRTNTIDFLYLHELNAYSLKNFLGTDNSGTRVQSSVAPGVYFTNCFTCELHGELWNFLCSLKEFLAPLQQYALTLQSIIRILKLIPYASEREKKFSRELINTCALFWNTFDHSAKSKELLQQVIEAIKDTSSSQSFSTIDTMFLIYFQNQLIKISDAVVPTIPVPEVKNTSAYLAEEAMDDEPEFKVGEFPIGELTDMFGRSMSGAFPTLSSPPPLPFSLSSDSKDEKTATASSYSIFGGTNDITLFGSPIPLDLFSQNNERLEDRRLSQ